MPKELSAKQQFFRNQGYNLRKRGAEGGEKPKPKKMPRNDDEDGIHAQPGQFDLNEHAGANEAMDTADPDSITNPRGPDAAGSSGPMPTIREGTTSQTFGPVSHSTKESITIKGRHRMFFTNTPTEKHLDFEVFDDQIAYIDANGERKSTIRGKTRTMKYNTGFHRAPDDWLNYYAGTDQLKRVLMGADAFRIKECGWKTIGMEFSEYFQDTQDKWQRKPSTNSYLETITEHMITDQGKGILYNDASKEWNKANTTDWDNSINNAKCKHWEADMYKEYPPIWQHIINVNNIGFHDDPADAGGAPTTINGRSMYNKDTDGKHNIQFGYNPGVPQLQLITTKIPAAESQLVQKHVVNSPWLNFASNKALLINDWTDPTLNQLDADWGKRTHLQDGLMTMEDIMCLRLEDLANRTSNITISDNEYYPNFQNKAPKTNLLFRISPLLNFMRSDNVIIIAEAIVDTYLTIEISKDLLCRYRAEDIFFRSMYQDAPYMQGPMTKTWAPGVKDRTGKDLRLKARITKRDVATYNYNKKTGEILFSDKTQADVNEYGQKIGNLNVATGYGLNNCVDIPEPRVRVTFKQQRNNTLRSILTEADPVYMTRSKAKEIEEEKRSKIKLPKYKSSK